MEKFLKIIGLVKVWQLNWLSNVGQVWPVCSNNNRPNNQVEAEAASSSKITTKSSFPSFKLSFYLASNRAFSIDWIKKEGRWPTAKFLFVGMSSEETNDAVKVSEDKKEAEAESGANESTSNAAEVDGAENVVDDEHEDPLVIDEAEEKSDGADSDEKVYYLST